jgi:SagB-type dehydrogenase family enzyme
MRRRDLDYVLIVAMLAAGLYAVVSGLLADLFGFPQFFLHRYAGYACAALVLVHLALNWGRIRAYLRQRLARPGWREREAPVPRERAPLLGRRGFLAAVLTGVGGFLLGRLVPTSQVQEVRQEGDLGQRYHQWSKPGGSGLTGLSLDWGPSLAPYKTYSDAPCIPLPDPRGFRGLALEEAVEARRSRREYAPGPLSLEVLSRLLHAAQGITDPARGFRAAPSAGALYPIETYAVVHDVAGLEPGLYHYAVADHALEQLRIADLRAEVVVAGVGQAFLGTAQVCFILSAIFQRTRWKYRERAYRYVLLEAGHVGQNLYLAATSMGLGACAVGAFLDDRLNGMLGVDGREEAVVYLIAVGRIA